jgi:hypothetical protein
MALGIWAFEKVAGHQPGIKGASSGACAARPESLPILFKCMYLTSRLTSMRVNRFLVFFFLVFIGPKLRAQDEPTPGTSIGITSGATSYQGDLQPNSFSFQQASFFAGAYVRQPLLEKLSIKAGINLGRLYAADKNNRDYLRSRNLSFYTALTEGFVALDYELLPLSKRRFTPFGYGALVYFHYNPYTYDAAGTKTYLQPLGTEGQGLSRYPERKPYKLSQVALAFGGGLRFLISDAVQVGLEIGQRKTFTDYLDDVSRNYADQDALLAARGPKAVELAYRGDELPGGSAYPREGTQRGKATEMDWYYMAGLSIEIKLRALATVGGGKYFGRRDVYNMRCPKVR